MKYLTPDLVARSRSEDETVAETAAAEWERACQAYNQRVKEIKPKLPRGVRSLLRRYYLHDAKVLTIAHDERPFFSIFLQLDPPPKEMIELAYRLAGKPQFVQHPSIAEDGGPLQWWLYDEVDVLEEGRLTAFTHSILLTGGWELRLLFSDMKCRRFPRTLFPGAAAALEETVREWEALPA